MEKLSHSPFSSLSIPAESEMILSADTLVIKKFNWDFKACEKFQLEALKLVSENKNLKVNIFTNHPHCFTLGRGNERDQDQLIDFDESLEEKLNFPLYRIHRGGGITFHYPGQLILYPIRSISQKYTLDDHMCELLKSVQNCLREHFGINEAITAKKLMGVWVNKKKIASVGVGMKKFVTLHGLALNIIKDQVMNTELLKVNPCGLNSDTYICLNELIDADCENLIENFYQTLVKSWQ